MDRIRTAVNIFPAQEKDLPALHKLFLQSAEEELPYKKISLEEFRDLFFLSSGRIDRFLYCAGSEDNILGFAGGCADLERQDAYLTFVLTAKPFRRQGIARQLTASCCQSVSVKKNTKLLISFFNPCALTWVLPGTPGHDHPNAPGVDVSSDAYLFFQDLGFVTTAYQNSFYLPLADYREPAFMAEKKKSLLSQGIELCLFDPQKHTGLKELTEDLGNPLWKEELLANEALGTDGYPLAAAIRDHRIVGFTGPLRVQESGRGYFAGIGVHSCCRGLGLGNVLFHTLCQTLKDMGAEYMTLFTGETNPAAQIYQKAGFRIVKTWADMDLSLTNLISPQDLLF